MATRFENMLGRKFIPLLDTINEKHRGLPESRLELTRQCIYLVYLACNENVPELEKTYLEMLQELRGLTEQDLIIESMSKYKAFKRKRGELTQEWNPSQKKIGHY